MGDRTTCSLHVSGFIHGPAELAILKSAIADNCGEPCEKIPDEPNPGPIPSSYTFYDVNWASMDSDLEDAMRRLCLSYVWSWGSGDEYAEGMIIVDTITDFHFETTTANDEIVLTLSEAENPAILATAKRANETMKRIIKTDLAYTNSAHAVIAHLAENTEALARWQQARKEEEYV